MSELGQLFTDVPALTGDELRTLRLLAASPEWQAVTRLLDARLAKAVTQCCSQSGDELHRAQGEVRLGRWLVTEMARLGRGDTTSLTAENPSGGRPGGSGHR